MPAERVEKFVHKSFEIEDDDGAARVAHFRADAACLFKKDGSRKTTMHENAQECT